MGSLLAPTCQAHSVRDATPLPRSLHRREDGGALQACAQPGRSAVPSLSSRLANPAWLGSGPDGIRRTLSLEKGHTMNKGTLCIKRL